MWSKIKKIFGNYSPESKSQLHFGNGDNIAGDKIINFNIEPQVEEFIKYHIENIKPNRKFSEEILTISFEKNISYPNLNFSITNKSNYPVQITGINCIRAACIKNKEIGELDYLTGPRLKINIDVEKINRGFRQRIFGDEKVSNLKKFESEAFQLILDTKNTSNLLELEIEYSSPIYNEIKVYVPPQLIFVGTPFEDDEFLNRKVCVIPRRKIITSLFNNENLKSLPNLILLRGAAYIFRFEDTARVLDLFAKYKENLHLSPILASYSEYIINNEVDGVIVKYLYEWIWDPSQITKTIITDIECFPVTIFNNLITGYSPKKKLIFSIQTLDQLIKIPNNINDISSGMNSFLNQVSLVILTNEVLKSIKVRDKRKIYPVVLSFLNVYKNPSLINDYLEKVIGIRSGISLGQSEATLEFWNNWYLSRKRQYLEYLHYSDRLTVIHSIIYEKLSEVTLIELSKSEDEIIRFALVRRKDLPPVILKKLAKDKNDTIRYEIANRKSTPKNILRLLSKDKNSKIRCRVAAHQNINLEIMERLSVDERVEVRGFLIGNPKLPIDLLKRIKDRETDTKLKEEINSKINSA